MIGGWPLFRSSQSPAMMAEIQKRNLKVVAVDALPEQLVYLERGLVPVLWAQPVYDWGTIGVPRSWTRCCSRRPRRRRSAWSRSASPATTSRTTRRSSTAGASACRRSTSRNRPGRDGGYRGTSTRPRSRPRREAREVEQLPVGSREAPARAPAAAAVGALSRDPLDQVVVLVGAGGRTTSSSARRRRRPFPHRGPSRICENGPRSPAEAASRGRRQSAAPDRSEITPLSLYLRRREFLALGAGSAVVGASPLAAGRARGAGRAAAARGRQARPVRHRREADALRGRHRATTTTTSSAPTRTTPPRTPARFRTRPWTVSFEGEIEQPADGRHRRPPELVPARGAHLPDALRRGLVDGDPVGRASRSPSSSRGSSRRRRRSTSPSRRSLDPSRCPGSGATCSTGPTSRACASTRRCTRWRSSRSASTAARCQPERRAAAAGGAVEVRLQGHQVDRQDPLRRERAADHLEPDGARASTASTRT